ncbi:MAG: DUF3106 domain-containing protein [Aquabacterium sp.]|uniref:DUF3106 domain-containing protein n=1 Tax=Aquabacterium sp. TaxID=1872578 RepID=UPI001226CC26|nr:DUF3106 domain-containing protein [Aquabacterium sp.]TAK93583.1 MAG: DUF3106 domain-containing protein [Aquabacterium sp.]
MKLPSPFVRTLPVVLMAMGLLWATHAPAKADAVLNKANAGSSVLIDTPIEWRELSAEQKQILQPLATHWSRMDETGRDKWVNVANRYKELSPADKARVQERMSQWAKLPAQERGEARLRFQQTRQLTPDQRQEKWAAYQALTAEDRQDLTRQAQRRAKPVLLADNMVGPREAKQAFAIKRNVAANNSDKKSNLVPNAITGTVATPTVVRPTMVKASTGATTTLVSQRPMPPMHQHTGLTKITASKAFVDPITMLPKKGAQSAAMASLPSSAVGNEPAVRR